MSSTISLPLFEISVSNPTLERLLNAMAKIDPSLEADVATWRVLQDLDVGSGEPVQKRSTVLRAALSAIDPEEVDQVLITRLDWLVSDLKVAPRCISAPPLGWEEGRSMPSLNVGPVVRGDDFETWISLRYLLGVLLSELHRAGFIDLARATEADGNGYLDIGDLYLKEAVVHVVRSIIAGDAGRRFPSSSPRMQRYGLDEQTQFAVLLNSLVESLDG